MWKLKVLVQFVLAKVPGGERANYLLQQARGSHRPETIRHHALEVLTQLRAVADRHPIEGCDVVEIGTGWDLVGAICLYLMGAKSVVTYDHVRHVRLSLARVVIAQMRAALDEISEVVRVSRSTLDERLRRFDSVATDSLDTLLRAAGIRYVAPGDAAKTGLPDTSVDIVYSHAVMEHVPESAVRDLTNEARRILKPTGMAFHFIGYGDHYASSKHNVSGVNFLQYSPRLWSFFVYNNIAYHNRLREKQFVDLFAAHGASVEVVNRLLRPGDLEALKTLKIHESFAGMTDEQLAVHNGLVALSFRERQI